MQCLYTESEFLRLRARACMMRALVWEGLVTGGRGGEFAATVGSLLGHLFQASPRYRTCESSIETSARERFVANPLL